MAWNHFKLFRNDRVCLLSWKKSFSASQTHFCKFSARIRLSTVPEAVVLLPTVDFWVKCHYCWLGLPLTEFFIILLSYKYNYNYTYDLILELTLSVSLVQLFSLPETVEGKLDVLSVDLRSDRKYLRNKGLSLETSILCFFRLGILRSYSVMSLLTVLCLLFRVEHDNTGFCLGMYLNKVREFLL